MGCGSSKFESEGELDQKSSRLLFRHRIEEIARRNTSELVMDSNLTSKVLLGGGGDEERFSSVGNGCKSVSSPLVKMELVKEEEDTARKSSVEVVVAKAVEDVEMVVGGDDNERDEEVEVEYPVREDCIMFSPGSPSFREYCFIDRDSTDGSKEDGKDELKSEAKLKRNKIVPLNPRKTKLGNKWRKGGRSLKVKSLFNATGCYNHAYTASFDGPQTLVGKVA